MYSSLWKLIHAKDVRKLQEAQSCYFLRNFHYGDSKRSPFLRSSHNCYSGFSTNGRMAFFAGVSNNLLVPLSATPKMLNCSCFTATMDTIDEATALVVGYHLPAQHGSYSSNLALGSHELKGKLFCIVKYVKKETQEDLNRFLEFFRITPFRNSERPLEKKDKNIVVDFCTKHERWKYGGAQGAL